MKKILILTLCLAVVLGFTGMAMAKTLKIGTMSPLTGPYAQDGVDIKQGVLTAVKVYGQVKGYDKVEVLPQDSACDGGKATMAANKLINDGVDVVIGAYCSSATEPAQIPLMEAPVVMITPSSTNIRLTSKGYKYFFRMPPRDDVQAWSTVEFFNKKAGIKTIALIDDKQSYTAGLTEAIKLYMKKTNSKVKIVAHEHITPGDSDFTAVLTKLKRLNPDLIYMSVYQPEGAKMTPQAKKLGITSILMSEDAVFQPQYLTTAGKSAEGVFFTFAKAPESELRTKYIEKYKSMWNSQSPGSYSFYAYDATMMILKSMEEIQTSDPDKLQAHIRNKTWPGVSGDVKFDKKGDRNLAHIIWIVKDGQFVPYWNPITGKDM